IHQPLNPQFTASQLLTSTKHNPTQTLFHRLNTSHSQDTTRFITF
ncbi:hypothetical protein LINPERPRIM_LOCUS37889, partial [Linum perenne]